MRGRWRHDDFGAEPTGHRYLHVDRPRLVVGGAPNPGGHSDRRHLADPVGGLSSRTASLAVGEGTDLGVREVAAVGALGFVPYGHLTRSGRRGARVRRSSAPRR